MHKVTVLYHHPEDVDAFEEYFLGHHLPLAKNMPGVSKIEHTKFVATPGGDEPEFHRMAELYFSSEAQMIETMGAPEGQATIDDLVNFATNGVKVLIGKVELY
jgi:uncharacterized protein (TIGR02118 family)